MKTLLVSAAAFGMAITPMSAQAGTRAVDSTVTLASLERQAAPVSVSEELGNDGFGICGSQDNSADVRRRNCDLLFYVGGAAVLVAIILAVSSASGNSEVDSSFGTGG